MIDYKKACEDALNSLEEEFWNGARAMLQYILENGTECLGKDDCIICKTGRKFLRRHRKQKNLQRGGKGK